MDQGDGQIHDANHAHTTDDALGAESAQVPTDVGHAEGGAGEASASAEQGSMDAPRAEKPHRGRKRAPVRVEAPVHVDASAPVGDVPQTETVAAEPVPAREPLPSIADRVEAVILSTERPLSAERVAIALGLIPEDAEASQPRAQTPATDGGEAPATKAPRGRKRPQSQVDEALSRVDAAVIELNQVYEQSGRSFRIEAVAGGYRVMTLARYAPDVARLRNAKVSAKLSRPAIETLAIIAYKQPMTRAELEAIRGVSCGEVLKSLLERRLITIKGRAEELGRPMLYGTTREFLDHFGLASIKDLPTVEELRASAGV